MNRIYTILKSFFGQKFYAIIVAVVVLVIAAVLVLGFQRSDAYSADVNGIAIRIKDVNTNLQAVISFYSKSGVNKEFEDSDIKELRRSMIEKLIENELIRAALIQTVPDYKSKVNERVENAISQSGKQQLEESAEALYGFSYNELRERMLKPLAEKEVLEESLNIKEADFTTWLRKAKDEASIKIFEPDYFWDEANLEVAVRK